MIMDPPITHPLTILIRQSTRTSECQLVPYTGSIAGHICVLAGGGEDAVVVSSLALSENFRCRLSENYRLGSARPRLPTGNVLSAEIYASTSKPQRRPVRRRSRSAAVCSC